MSAPLLSIRNLLVERNGLKALDLPALDIYQGETLAVIGPNGAGKTTLMMAVCGLIPIQRGEIQFCGRKVVPHKDLSYRRRLAIVMQDPLLLHASVRDNIAAGLKFRHAKPDEIRTRVRDWLTKLSITTLENRPAHQISGGEAQRVSLARAFVLQPDLMLLDEPFSALDAPTRGQLLVDLKKQLGETRLAAIFITHDLDEALALADRLAIFIQGRLRQVGTPKEIFQSPADPEIAHFTGAETIIPGQITCQKGGQVEVDCGQLKLQARSNLQPGVKVYLCLRPEDLAITRAGDPGSENIYNHISGRIQLMVPLGPLVRIVVQGPVLFTALLSRNAVQELDLREGLNIQAAIPIAAVQVIPA